MTEELKNKEKKAIERLKAFEPDNGYFLAYSGGKDGDTIKILAELAGVKFEAVHTLTSVDAPETVNYIKSQKNVKIRIPRDKNGKHITMWNLIPKKRIPPTRLMRYCCNMKESAGHGRLVVTGVRWSESTRRKEHAGLVKFMEKPKTTQKLAEEIGVDYRVTKQGGIVLNNDNDTARKMVEACYESRKTIINPIIDWEDEDVWKFLKYYGCKSNPLYECGFKRIGCVGCPMAGKIRKYEFERYPKYKDNYIKAFDRMLANRLKEGLEIRENWKTGEEVFNWWMG